MEDENKRRDEYIGSTQDPQYSVILPCSQEDFGDFVSGLLGKSQTIERVFGGTFEIGRQEIENTYHLLDQRIRQQNEATLIQFTAKLVYQDASSILLNSLDDFLHYVEVRPLISVAVHLSWTYMIRFRDKRFPEKQQIEMSIVSGQTVSRRLASLEEARFFFEGFHSSTSFINIRISHTARTWGVDMESLLTGHIETLLKDESPLKKYIYNHSGIIGLAFGILFFLVSVVGAYITLRRIWLAKVEAVQSFLAEDTTKENLIKKIDYLIQSLVKGDYSYFDNHFMLSILISVPVAIALGTWIGSTADNRPRSFLLLSKKAEEFRGKYLEKRKRRWLVFSLSVATSLVTGIIANVIFAYWFRR